MRMCDSQNKKFRGRFTMELTSEFFCFAALEIKILVFSKFSLPDIRIGQLTLIFCIFVYNKLS